MVSLPESPRARWRALRAFYQHSVDVMDNARSSDYMAKHDSGSRGLWGADRELAKASSKKGRAAGRTPFQLLADYRDGSEKAGRLYVEYVEAIRGRPPVYWSQGLKRLVGVEDLNDAQLAERQDDQADLLGLIELPDWRLVRRMGYRAHLLTAAEIGGWTGVEALLTELSARIEPRSGGKMNGAGTRSASAVAPREPAGAPGGFEGSAVVPALRPVVPEGPAAVSALPPAVPGTHLLAATVQRRSAREARLQHRLYAPPLPD